MATTPTIISLCDFTGAWSSPYLEAGYEVIQVDIKHGYDARLFKRLPYPVRGVLAAPPCTHLASSGAAWWEKKGEAALLEAMAVVDACLRIIVAHDPLWWVLENPVGRLRHYLGEPEMMFDPRDYGDDYTKKTCLWGRFKKPLKRPVPVPAVRPGSHAIDEWHKRQGTWDRSNRQALRSITPAGFARAFFNANP